MDFPLDTIKKPEFKTLDVLLEAAALSANAALRAHGLMVISATGNVSLRFSSGAVADVKVGQALNTKENSEEMQLLSVTSDIPGDTIVLLYGDGHLTSLASDSTITEPLGDDGYSIAVGNKLYQPTAQAIGIGNSQQYATKGFPIASCVIGGNATATVGAHALVEGFVQGNITHIPVLNLQTGDVYWDGKIPGTAFGAQYKFQMNVSAMDNIRATNNSDVPLGIYPSFGNGVMGPYKPV